MIYWELNRDIPLQDPYENDVYFFFMKVFAHHMVWLDTNSLKSICEILERYIQQKFVPEPLLDELEDSIINDYDLIQLMQDTCPLLYRWFDDYFSKNIKEPI